MDVMVQFFQIPESGGMKIFSGNANQPLAKDIAAYLGINLGRVKVCVCVCRRDSAQARVRSKLFYWILQERTIETFIVVHHELMHAFVFLGCFR